MQTKAGGKKVAAKLLARDPDYYRKIGKIGGQNGHTGGFSGNAELASRAGRKGGSIGSKKADKAPLEVRRREWERKHGGEENEC